MWAATYFLPAGWALLVNGGGILLLLIFLPEGLGGIMYRIRDALLGLAARRRHMTPLGLIQQIEELDGQIGEDLLVERAAVATEHLEEVTEGGTHEGVLATSPTLGGAGAGAGAGGTPSTVTQETSAGERAERAGPEVRGPSGAP